MNETIPKEPEAPVPHQMASPASPAGLLYTQAGWARPKVRVGARQAGRQSGRQAGRRSFRGEVRKSIKIQAAITKIGAKMGFKIWIPAPDRNGVFSELGAVERPFIDKLPLNYDDRTVKIIEAIDVLWVKGRSIVRAFEVEHTTLIYSGILRMADLLALQPNMNIKLHLVAPCDRRDDVFYELQRPAFSLVGEEPLSKRCTYLSYDSVEKIAADTHLNRLSDRVLDDYGEEA
jgi:hypothetical protein